MRHFLRQCYGMQPTETVNGRQPDVVARKSHSPYQYRKVLDGRKQPIRGLWERNRKSVARIAVWDDADMKHYRWVHLAC